MFSKGEKNLDMGGGYTDAWGVGTLTAQNGFFIKPARGSPNTNIHIVTNKRVYNLDMILVKTENVTSYEFIQYRYPEEELNEKRKRQIKRLLGELHEPTLDAVKAYFETFGDAAGPFYFGDNNRSWRAGFDYLLRSDLLVKTREGAL